jgi:hypothetical protein
LPQTAANPASKVVGFDPADVQRFLDRPDPPMLAGVHATSVSRPAGRAGAFRDAARRTDRSASSGRGNPDAVPRQRRG